MRTTIWKNHNLFRVWVWCLMRASWAEREISVGLTKVFLEPGQFVFGRHAAAAELGMSPSTVYDCLQRLVSDNKLDIKSDNKKSVVTVVNWALYQPEPIKSDSKTDNKPDSWAESDIKSDNKPVKSDSKSGTNNNIKQLNNINNNNRTTVAPVDNLDNLTTRLRLLLGTAVAQRWLTDPQYGPDYCRAQLGYVDSKGDVTSARAYVQAALVGNYADWKRPAPKPDPHCPKCGGTGRATTWVDAGNGALDGHAHLCTCVPRPALQQQPQHQAAAPDDPDHRDTAALAARVAAARTP